MRFPQKGSRRPDRDPCASPAFRGSFPPETSPATLFFGRSAAVSRKLLALASCVAFLALPAMAASQVSKKDLPQIWGHVKEGVLRGETLGQVTARLRAKGLIDDSPQGVFNATQARAFFAEL